MIPQILLFVLNILGLGIIMAKHGESTKHNAYATTAALILQYALLYWGGFFDIFF
jgi:hypothetical protein